MKLKLIVPLSIITVISLFANLVLSLNISEIHSEKKDAISQVQAYEEKIDYLESKEETQTENKLEYSDGSEIEKLLESFFRTYYEYDQENYKDRIPNIKPYVSDEVYGQLTAAGTPDIPSISFSNTVEDLQIYLTNKNEHIDSIILLDTQYEVEDFENSVLTQVFNVEIKDDVITKLELVGTFSKMNES